MASTEYLPDYYRNMIAEGLVIPEDSEQFSGKDPFADPYDDPGFNEEAFLKMSETDAVSKSQNVDSITLMLEAVDPLEGRTGAKRVGIPDRMMISDPLISLTMRSHVFPEALPAAIKYEGVEYTRTVGNKQSNQLIEKEKAWENQTRSGDAEEVDGALWYLRGKAQVVEETLAVDIYRNPLLAGVCLGIAPWEQAVQEISPGQKPDNTEGFHVIAFKAAKNYEMTGLTYDDPVKKSLHSLYSMIPERKEDILFEGRLLPGNEQGQAEFIPDSLHVPQGIDDMVNFRRNQRGNATQYLLNPTPESPSLITRMLDPRCSKLIIS